MAFASGIEEGEEVGARCQIADIKFEFCISKFKISDMATHHVGDDDGDEGLRTRGGHLVVGRVGVNIDRLIG